MALLPIGEVIAAATSYFTAQCVEVPRSDALPTLPDAPAFGTFVRVGEAISPGPALGEDEDPFETAPPGPRALPEEGGLALYGVVFHAENGPLEPGRSVTAFGLEEAELRRSQPQIYELLATRFSAALIAHAGSDGVVRPYLPPRPPRLHARVWPVRADETRRLTERLDYLRPLLSGGAASGSAAGYPPDELVAALLRSAQIEAYPDDDRFLLRAGRELGALLPMDYDRLRALIARILA